MKCLYALGAFSALVSNTPTLVYGSTDPFSYFGDISNMLSNWGSNFSNAIANGSGLSPWNSHFASQDSTSLSVETGPNKDLCRVRLGKIPSQNSSDKIAVNADSRSISFSIKNEGRKEESSETNGFKQMRQYVSHSESSSTVYMPEWCILFPNVISNGYSGILVDENGSSGTMVFPSKRLLEKYVGENLLSEEIFEIAKTFDANALNGLIPLEKCLLAGFTRQECESFGDVKPQVIENGKYNIYKISSRNLMDTESATTSNYSSSQYSVSEDD